MRVWLKCGTRMFSSYRKALIGRSSAVSIRLTWPDAGLGLSFKCACEDPCDVFARNVRISSRIFHRPAESQQLIRKVLLYGLILGIVGNVIFAATAGNEAPIPPSAEAILGVIAYAFGVPAMALSIAAGVAVLWQIPAMRSVLAVLAPVGRMALTNYLMQTVICVFIFYGFGFGRFGKVGAASATLIALTIFASQIVISSIWLKYFNYGPMEWNWRQLTYGKRLELRQRSGIENLA